jgi:lysophospholipase L1-like esterase
MNWKGFFISAIFFLQLKPELNAQSFKFAFGEANKKKGFTNVKSTDLYTTDKGFGFEFSEQLNLYSKYITSNKPFYFSVTLPEGNYNVKVLLGDENGTSVTTIKAECRRLMVEKVETKKGQFKTVAFTVHVRDSVIRSASGNSVVRLKPREISYLHWDNKLTLEFNNTSPKLSTIEIDRVNNIPTIFLAGNSTVVDQAYEPWAAWGQMIPSFFQPGVVAVANYAESGETLKAFRAEKRLEKLWSMAKPGDYLLIEFAHNDQKPGSSHLDPFTTYRETLKEWIKEARDRQVTPILVTSMNRRTFDSTGHITNSLGDYPEAMRQTGREENVAVIDLNAMSKNLYEALGPERSVKAFVHFAANSYPNQPKDVEDNTHFRPYGAYELARCVVMEIEQKIPALTKYLKKNLPTFDPAKPDDPNGWSLPESSFVGMIKPDGN